MKLLKLLILSLTLVTLSHPQTQNTHSVRLTWTNTDPTTDKDCLYRSDNGAPPVQIWCSPAGTPITSFTDPYPDLQLCHTYTYYIQAWAHNTPGILSPHVATAVIPCT